MYKDYNMESVGDYLLEEAKVICLKKLNEKREQLTTYIGKYAMDPYASTESISDALQMRDFIDDLKSKIRNSKTIEELSDIKIPK